jgi:hypothetical protein
MLGAFFLMRFRVFFEIKSLSAITAFELFFSLFHKAMPFLYLFTEASCSAAAAPAIVPAISRRALNVYRVPRHPLLSRCSGAIVPVVPLESNQLVVKANNQPGRDP